MTSLRSLCLGTAALPALPVHCWPPPNPFAKPSTLPLQAPPFDKIKDSDYQPALEEGMKQQIAEIDAIANSKADADFREHRSSRWRNRAACSTA